MEHILHFFNNLNVELFSAINFIVYLIVMIGMLAFGGLNGLQGFVYLALVISNIQVLKGSNFFFSDEPVALGTLVYGMVSIALSIITEFYGEKEGKKTITLGFIFMTGFTLFIILTLGYKPIEKCSDELQFLCENHFFMMKLFAPIPAILISGMIAYFVSERSLIFIQIFTKKLFKNRLDNIRIYCANFISAFVDLFVMNYLCWILLADQPITIFQMFATYILPSYPFRFFTAILSIPSIYLARKVFNKNIIKS